MDRIREYINNRSDKNEIYLQTMDLFFEDLDEPSLWNQFIERVQPELAAKQIQNIDHICEHCEQAMLTNEPEAIAVCQLCGLTKQLLIMYVNYKDKTWELTGYPYKRITHFRKHLKKLDRRMDVSRELHDRLEHMFKVIQTPFNKHRPTKRKNFSNYSYIIKKLLELNGQY